MVDHNRIVRANLLDATLEPITLNALIDVPGITNQVRRSPKGYGDREGR